MRVMVPQIPIRARYLSQPNVHSILVLLMRPAQQKRYLNCITPKSLPHPFLILSSSSTPATHQQPVQTPWEHLFPHSIPRSLYHPNRRTLVNSKQRWLAHLQSTTGRSISNEVQQSIPHLSSNVFFTTMQIMNKISLATGRKICPPCTGFIKCVFSTVRRMGHLQRVRKPRCIRGFLQLCFALWLTVARGHFPVNLGFRKFGINIAD